jgi:RimJ/RimL family protein N-acetyltransferase
MNQIVEPDTKRLRLRQWRVGDREPFAALNADERVMEFFPARLDRETSDALADRLERFIEEHGWGLWVAELKGSHDFIGFIGLCIPHSEIPVSPCVEVGWRLAYRYWGNGYVTEGAKSAMQVGFEVLGPKEILSLTSVLNLRSRGVMERLGMVEDRDTFEHPHIPPGSRLRTHCAYRLSRERWVASGTA